MTVEPWGTGAPSDGLTATTVPAGWSEGRVPPLTGTSPAALICWSAALLACPVRPPGTVVMDGAEEEGDSEEVDGSGEGEAGAE